MVNWQLMEKPLERALAHLTLLFAIILHVQFCYIDHVIGKICIFSCVNMFPLILYIFRVSIHH